MIRVELRNLGSSLFLNVKQGKNSVDHSPNAQILSK